MRRQLKSTLFLTGLLAGLVAVLPASADESTGLVQIAEWTGDVFASSPDVLPMVAVDAPARTAYVLSGGAQLGLGDQSAHKGSWSRVQTVGLDTGRPTSPRVDIPPLDIAAPVLVDSRRRILIYPELPEVGGSAKAYAGSPVLVGIGLVKGSPRVLFRVTSRITSGRVVGLTLSPDGADLVVVSTTGADNMAQEPRVTAAVTLDWISIAGLLRQADVSQWSAPYQVPTTLCPELIATHQPAAVLVTGSILSLPCRAVSDSSNAISLGEPSGVITLTEISAAHAPASAVFFPAPGNYADHGESFADTTFGRMALIDYSDGGQGSRVFDVKHHRYVGMIKTSQGLPTGVSGDPATGRIYFSGGTPGIAIGAYDLAPVVPTQGYIDTTHFGQALSGTAYLRMTFDPVAHRLLIPRGLPGHPGVSILLVSDRIPPVKVVVNPPPDVGALDAAEVPGRTASTRSASVHAFGADYQLVGGTANLFQNISGIDGTGAARPGTRFLRQSFVEEATLGEAESSARAFTAKEDRATDADRNGVGPLTNGAVDGGNQFAPGAACSDFGNSPVRRSVAVAQVSCDSEGQQTTAEATFDAVNGVFLTTQGTSAPVPAPVQVGSSSVTVVERRAAGLGPAVVVVTARAENISLLGSLHIGRVESSIAVSAHGRPGSAVVAPRKVTVTGVSLDGSPLCELTCPLDHVTTALNTALGSRGHVDFPSGTTTRSPGGTLASFGQDPWYHAERVLDYDKSDDDFTVPAMTVVINLEGRIKSRLAVDFAGMDAASLYRIFALARPVDRPAGPPDVGLPGTALPHSVDLPGVTSPQSAAPLTATAIPSTGPIHALVRMLRFGLRSPSAALPVLLVWALLATGPYLSARRRLLLELPLLSREQEYV